ncbi:MAG: hypothetical protein JSU92_02675 [Deltaproteobacteria bacterium]|nr:MAG: hypothetical protein JSU92_02675 [Deltaproteobacteria bacterium]
MRVKSIIAAVGLIVFLTIAHYSSAETTGRHSRLLLTNQIKGRAIPEGVSDTIELNYRYYYSGSDSILFQNNHLGIGFAESISPATNSVGGFIEIEPVAVFNLRIQYEYIQYFGVLTAILTFPDKDSDYSDDILDERKENGDAEWATGSHISILPTFQIKIGRFVALDMLSFEWWEIDKNNYFYEPSNDTLMKTSDYFFTNATIAGLELWSRDENTMMILGTRYTHFRVESADKIRKQLDGIMIWMMGEKRWWMEKPVLVTVAGGILEDKYREGSFFAGIVFEFEYSLLPRQ